MWQTKINELTHIDLESTTFCNLKCPECVRENKWVKGYLNTTHMTRGECEIWFDPEELTSLEEIRFCGAIDEMAANPHAHDIIDYIREEFENRVRVNISTNGSLKTEKWWSDLAKKLPSNSEVVFGIDGLKGTSEIYRRGSNWDKVITNAKAFIAAGGNAKWQFIEFAHNRHEVVECRDLSRELGFSKFLLLTSTRDDTVVEHSKDGLELLTESYNRSDAISCENQGNGMGHRILVNSSGVVTPCCFLNGRIPHYMSSDEFDYGDRVWRNIMNKNGGLESISLYKKSLKDILEGQFFADIQDSWSNDPIPRCQEVCGSCRKVDQNIEI